VLEVGKLDQTALDLVRQEWQAHRVSGGEHLKSAHALHDERVWQSGGLGDYWNTANLPPTGAIAEWDRVVWGLYDGLMEYCRRRNAHFFFFFFFLVFFFVYFFFSWGFCCFFVVLHPLACGVR